MRSRDPSREARVRWNAGSPDEHVRADAVQHVKRYLEGILKSSGIRKKASHQSFVGYVKKIADAGGVSLPPRLAEAVWLRNEIDHTDYFPTVEEASFSVATFLQTVFAIHEAVERIRPPGRFESVTDAVERLKARIGRESIPPDPPEWHDDMPTAVAGSRPSLPALKSSETANAPKFASSAVPGLLDSASRGRPVTDRHDTEATPKYLPAEATGIARTNSATPGNRNGSEVMDVEFLPDAQISYIFPRDMSSSHRRNSAPRRARLLVLFGTLVGCILFVAWVKYYQVPEPSLHEPPVHAPIPDGVSTNPSALGQADDASAGPDLPPVADAPTPEPSVGGTGKNGGRKNHHAHETSRRQREFEAAAVPAVVPVAVDSKRIEPDAEAECGEIIWACSCYGQLFYITKHENLCRQYGQHYVHFGHVLGPKITPYGWSSVVSFKMEEIELALVPNTGELVIVLDDPRIRPVVIGWYLPFRRLKD